MESIAYKLSDLFVFIIMASSVSWQDKPNRTLWLATQVGKILPPGINRHVLWEKFLLQPNNKSFIDQAFPVKMAGYRPHSLLRVYGPLLCLGPLTHKKQIWPISAILTSRLVNSPYMLSLFYFGSDP